MESMMGTIEAGASFEPDTASVPAARQLVLGCPALRDGPASTRDVVALLVSELAANAVNHAGTPFTVQLQLLEAGTVVHVEVADASTRLPRPHAPSIDVPTGRGLSIVERLADRWGFSVVPDGKCVWFEVVLDT